MAKALEIEGLNCHAQALCGIRLVLLTRLEEMCARRSEALDWSDIEGVHDMRVASRRLRSALRDFKPYLRGKVRQKKLREVAHALGRVRDEDVAIKALEKLTEEAPEDISAGLNQIIDERRGQREKSREALEEAISKTSIDRLQEKLSAGFERATRGRAVAVERANTHNSDGQSFRSAGREIILKQLEEVLGLGVSLYRPFDVDSQHRLRIAAKRLRYAMELFYACWGKQLKPFSDEVEKMQGSLGDLHDCDVWIEGFGKRLTDGSEIREGTTPARLAVRAAAVWLLHHYKKERTRHYRHALARWFEWEKTAFSARLVEALSEDAEQSHEPRTAAATVS
ncbi:MAG TPA: CHAD domain-containing protein [Pyrinomonadaceae bacterium]|jgi:CHAD domain-containing protein